MTNISKASQVAENEQKILQSMSDGMIRIAVVGNVDSGKSTLIGTLTLSTLDNGKGANRTKIAKHKHEAETGRTSAISSHLMGFDESGNVSPSTTKHDEARIAHMSHRVVSLMDLAGHEKYLRTTIAGLSTGMADYVLVLVSATQPPTHMTMKHLHLCISLGIPVIAVLTKSDACPSDVFRNTKKALQHALRSPQAGKRPYDVTSAADVETVKDKMHCLAPVITTSCVTGEGLDILQKLLFALPKRRLHQNKIDRPFEFLIEDTFVVTGVGLVLSGFVNAGRWNKGDSLYIGPLADGSYIKTTAKSAHVAQTTVSRCWAGHSACFAVALTKDQRKIFNRRKGMVVLKAPVTASQSFTADICVMKGLPVTMNVGCYRTTAHILHLKRPVQLMRAENADSSLTVVRSGERAQVTFKCSSSEYIRKGMRVILRDGIVHAVGVVTATIP